MTPGRLERLAGLLARHGFDQLSWCEGEDEIHMGRTGGAAPAQGGMLETLRAPFAGRLRWQHPCDEGLPRQPGASLAAGEIAAWIAVGPLLRPVRLKRAARLVRLESSTDSIVGWGQALALLASHSKD